MNIVDYLFNQNVMEIEVHCIEKLCNNSETVTYVDGLKTDEYTFSQHV